MTISPFGFPGIFDPWGSLSSSPPPPASPPASPPPASPPASPPVSEPVDIVTVTGRRPGGGIGYRPIFWGGGGGGTPAPPAPPPTRTEDGVEVVTVTGQRQGRFATAAEARDFGIALIQAQSDRDRTEYGLFVVKVGDRYDVTELVRGEGRNGTLAGYSRNGTEGTVRVPENAVGFLHSHPPGIRIEVDPVYNRYLSENDLIAWRFFKEVTGNQQFKMWLIGPDGQTREFDQESDVPPAALEPPRDRGPPLRSPDPRTVPDVGPDMRWRGPPGPTPTAPPPPEPTPAAPPPPERPPQGNEQWR